MSLIPNDYPKPDLFLVIFKENEPINATNYKIDDLFDLAVAQRLNDIGILCLYENSELNSPIISQIRFMINNGNYSLSSFVIEDDTITNKTAYNNKIYYKYIKKLS